MTEVKALITNSNRTNIKYSFVFNGTIVNELYEFKIESKQSLGIIYLTNNINQSMFQIREVI